MTRRALLASALVLFVASCLAVLAAIWLHEDRWGWTACVLLFASAVAGLLGSES